MCIMPKVKKCEKTFALNVDIFIFTLYHNKLLTNKRTPIIIHFKALIERSTMSGHLQRTGDGGSPAAEHMGITLRSCKQNG